MRSIVVVCGAVLCVSVLGVWSAELNRQRIARIPTTTPVTVTLPLATSSETIAYEDLATAIDHGHMSDYAGRRLRIRGHIRAYVIWRSDTIVVLGERSPAEQFPTIFCTVAPSESHNALQFRGESLTTGPSDETELYQSAAPDRIVILDVQFLGLMKDVAAAGMDVYRADDCKFVE